MEKLHTTSVDPSCIYVAKRRTLNFAYVFSSLVEMVFR